MIKNVEAAMPMCRELEAWCKSQKLPYLRADDLAANVSLNAAQKDWLDNFRIRWKSLKMQTTQASRRGRRPSLAEGSKLMTIDVLIERYIDAADALESAQRSMQPIVDATNSFVAARDDLREHPAFSGFLPKTFFSGSELDPLGVDGEGSDGNS